MTLLEMTAGELAPTPALLRGAPTQGVLSTLIGLATHDDPADQAADWLRDATLTILGQLAVGDPSASDAVVKGSDAAARRQGSLTGLESILLTALCGSSNSREVQASASRAWAYFDAARISSDVPVPVLDPSTGRLVFLTGEALARLTGLALREQLAVLSDTQPSLAGAGRETAAEAIVMAASAVASIPHLTALPVGDPLRESAMALLPDGSGSTLLPGMLAKGQALLVEVLVPAGDVADDGLDHPFWGRRDLSPSLPLSGSGLARLVEHRGATTILPWLPRLDASGTTVRQGFYPPLGQDPARPDSAGVSRTAVSDAVAALRRGTPAAKKGAAPEAVVIDGRVFIIVGGEVLDPLTGVVVDELTGLPKPGSVPGEMFSPRRATEDALGQLKEAFRVTGLPASSTVGTVLDRLAEVDVGLRLPGRHG